MNSNETREQMARVRSAIEERKRQIEELEQQQRLDRYELRRLQDELETRLREEAEERERNKLAPNFDDPWLKAFMSTLENHPAYSTLRQFQKEDLVNLAWKLRTGADGLINANDMGLGKTAETVVLICVLAEMRNNNVPFEKLDLNKAAHA